MFVFNILLLFFAGDQDNTVVVPIIEKPMVDNQIAAGEWENAARISLPDGGTVLIGTDGETLYIATDQMPEARFGFGCIFLASVEDIHVLHASAQLGSALYRRDGSTWQPENTDYSWKKAPDMWREEHWQAGVSPKRTQEFAISRKRLGEEPFIALGYILIKDRRPRAIGWPASLSDATRDIDLLSGNNPGDLVFDTNAWARLRFR